jgi:hypothetical protein
MIYRALSVLIFVGIIRSELARLASSAVEWWLLYASFNPPCIPAFDTEFRSWSTV